MKGRAETMARSGARASIVTRIELPAEGLTIVAAPPVTLSQLNVEAVTGIGARTFLELIRSPGFPVRVAKIKKLRIVDCAEFICWIKAQHAPAPANDATDDAEPDEDPDAGVDAVLAELELESVTPAGRSKGRR